MKSNDWQCKIRFKSEKFSVYLGTFVFFFFARFDEQNWEGTLFLANDNLRIIEKILQGTSNYAE